MLRRHTTTVYTDLTALPSRYEPIFSRAGNTSLFFSLPWYRNFIQSVLTPSEQLRIFAVDAAANTSSPLAVLPMRYPKTASGLFGVRTLSGLSNYYTSLFGPVIEPGESDVQMTLDSLAAAIARDFGFRSLVLWGPGEQEIAHHVVETSMDAAEMSPPTAERTRSSSRK